MLQIPSYPHTVSSPLNIHPWGKNWEAEPFLCEVQPFLCVSTEEQHQVSPHDPYNLFLTKALSLTSPYLIFQESCSSLCAECAGAGGQEAGGSRNEGHHPERPILSIVLGDELKIPILTEVSCFFKPHLYSCDT